MMDNLNGKKVLLFAPRFFNYETEILAEIQNNGAAVDYYDERCLPNTVEKILIRKCKYLVRNKINNYYRAIFSNLTYDQYDYVFFVSPETVTPQLLDELKSRQSKAKFILYMYDSIKNKKADKIIKCFDTCFSFDKKDCESYHMFFLPLFYLHDYSMLPNDSEITYDVAFIGTIHSDRWSVLKKIKAIAESNNLTVFLYMYFPSRVLYLVSKMLKREYTGTTKSDFRFIPMARKDVVKELSSARVIIDIQHRKQIGLTIRTLETIAMRKRLITTNHDIVNYDFYDRNNTLIIDRNNPVIDIDWLSKDYTILPKNVYENYSITRWIQNIFSN